VSAVSSCFHCAIFLFAFSFAGWYGYCLPTAPDSRLTLRRTATRSSPASGALGVPTGRAVLFLGGASRLTLRFQVLLSPFSFSFPASCDIPPLCAVTAIILLPHPVVQSCSTPSLSSSWLHISPPSFTSKRLHAPFLRSSLSPYTIVRSFARSFKYPIPRIFPHRLHTSILPLLLFRTHHPYFHFIYLWHPNANTDRTSYFLSRN
jgi:hypothetical protein